MKTESLQKKTQCLRLTLRGAVQGVGFRPFVYRLASELGLFGNIKNCSEGVLIEVEGDTAKLSEFLLRIQKEKPPLAELHNLEALFLASKGYSCFDILESSAQESGHVWMLPDIALCASCKSEVSDPRNRRYRYPFTNCSHCGPRYSILKAIPYDRENTTMREFRMCGECRTEYLDPLNRRFHAQPNACPWCGPHVTLIGAGREVLAEKDAAIREAVRQLQSGRILAVKGLGGFHLMADAANEEAVVRLRLRKSREYKPLALMMSDLEAVRKYCEVSTLEARLLESPEAPIVLLKKREISSSRLAASAAPQNLFLGVMLPYTPLHEILIGDMGGPLVATSGNISDEPIAVDNEEAMHRLANIADYFLVHDRAIVRPVDDSVVRVVAGREMMIRRGRGFAPLPVARCAQSPSFLAVGGHLKNTIAQNVGGHLFLGQHIGDLDNVKSTELFQDVVQTFKKIYQQKPDQVICDLHPQYASTRYAQTIGLPRIQIQHHYAHALACMADNEVKGPALAVVWDGMGLGPDGTLWGGEFLRIHDEGFTRVAHSRQFRLPGLDQAAREPRRCALAVLYEIYGEQIFRQSQWQGLSQFTGGELQVLEAMLGRGIQSPLTSSVGRLFDAVAALLGICPKGQFEGQAAMELEFAIGHYETDDTYPFHISESPLSGKVFDWEPMIRCIVTDAEQGISSSKISAKFHNTLAEVIVKLALGFGENAVVLSGGCFQNKYLLERTIARLQDQGFSPYWHRRIPTNDGGISAGQILGALRQQESLQKMKEGSPSLCV